MQQEKIDIPANELPDKFVTNRDVSASNVLPVDFFLVSVRAILLVIFCHAHLETLNRFTRFTFSFRTKALRN